MTNIEVSVTGDHPELRARYVDVEGEHALLSQHFHDWENCLHEFAEPQDGTIETGEPVTVVKCIHCSMWIIERRHQ